MRTAGRPDHPCRDRRLLPRAAPNDGLADALKAAVPDVRVIGDAVEARRVTEAIAEAALAVLAIEQGAARVGFDHDLQMAAD